MGRIIVKQVKIDRQDIAIVRLSDQHHEIIKFCKTPKSASEISEEFQLTLNKVYKRVFVLKKGGYIKRLDRNGSTHTVRFKSENRITDAEAQKVMLKPMFMGVRL